MSEPKLAFNDMFHLRKHTNDNVMVSPLASLFSFHFKDGENMTLQIMMMIQVTLLTMMFSTLGEILTHMFVEITIDDTGTPTPDW